MNAARGVALMVVPQKIRSEGSQWEVIALDGMKRMNAAEKWSIRLLQADLGRLALAEPVTVLVRSGHLTAAAWLAAPLLEPIVRQAWR